MRLVAVQCVGDHGLLRGGVDGKHRATQRANNEVQYSIDEYIWAACVTTHVGHGYLHRVLQTICALTCELVSSPCRSSYPGGLGCRLQRLHLTVDYAN